MSNTLTLIAVQDITPHPNNPRLDLGDLTELVASITAHGVLQPLVVVPVLSGDYVININERSSWRVVAGHRRLAAAKLAGLDVVPCIPTTLTPVEQLEVMLVENIQRSDLTVVEEAHAYQQLLEFDGYTPTKIAKNTGRAVTTIRKRVALTTLPDSTLAHLETGQISLGDAEKLLQLVDYPDLFEQAERYVGTYNFEWAIKNAKATITKRKEHTKLRETLQARGVTLIPGSDTTDDTLPVTWLRPPMSADDHEDTCNHHIWTIDDNGTITAECTNPDSHLPATNTAGHNSTPKASATRMPADDPFRDLADDLRKADNVRAAWVQNNLTDSRLIISENTAHKLLQAAALVFTNIDEYDLTDDVFEALGQMPPENADPHDHLRELLADPSLDYLAKVLFVMNMRPTEQFPLWGWRASNNAERLHTLIDLGYTPTPAELKALELVTELRAEQHKDIA